MGKRINVNIIICTYNRAASLDKALDSITHIESPKDTITEIILVNNNSQDNTEKIVEKYQNRPFTIKNVFEEKQGLSHARNRGTGESRGKYIAFIDDDALADRKWIVALHETFQRYGCDGIGGRIYLKPVRKLPGWLTKDLWGFLACLDYGDQPFQIDRRQFIYGTNMAFPREIFNKVGYFNTELGRTGYMPIGGEETELLGRILSCGGKVYYQPKAEVYHIIDEYKLRKQYFRRLHYYEGHSSGKAYDMGIKSNLCGIPLFMFPQLMRSLLRYLTNPTLRMQMNVCWFLGFMKGRMMDYKSKFNAC